MSIKWHHGANIASNVPQNTDLYNHRVNEDQIIKIIGENSLTSISTSIILESGIDTLSVTIPSYDQDHEKFIKERCLQLKHQEKFKGKHLLEIKEAGSIYRHHFQYTTPSKDDIRIDFSPYKTSLNYFRLEIHPSRLYASGEINIFIDLMRELHFLGLDPLTFHITRLDPYIDLAIPTPNVICKSTARVGRVIKGNDKTIETHYLGSTTSDLEFRIYDKAFKNAKDGKPNKHKYITRIEIAIRDQSIPTLVKLNPFDRLDLYVCPQNIQHHDMQFQMFMDSCYMRGLPQVLARLSPSQAKPYLDKLKTFTPHYWDPQQVNELYRTHLLQLLETLTLLE